MEGESAPLLEARTDRRASDGGTSSKKYGSLRRDSEAVLRAEGVAPNEDTTLLWILLLMSSLMTVVGVIYAVYANSMAVVVEATAEFLDVISYSLNLYCVYLTRGKPMEYKENLEKRTAIGSTTLLILCAVRIGLSAYSEMACASDVDFNLGDPSDVPCALMQGRPKPKMVMITASVMLLAYIPPVWYVMTKGGSMNSYHPSEDINKASALLHVAFDMTLQVTVLLSSLVMVLNASVSVEIDAWASIFVIVMMLVMTGWMWYVYYDSASDLKREHVEEA